MTSSRPDRTGDDTAADADSGGDGTDAPRRGGVLGGYRTHPVTEELVNLDRNVYRAVAATPTPTMDEAFRRISLVGDHGAVWFAIAGGVAALGGRRGRHAAVDGIVSLLTTSVVVNLLMKPALPRDRPDRELHQVIVARHVPLPRSTSFPSGHSSSAFAFANGMSAEMPELAVPLRLAAAAMAWSRVHTGVHYPGDIISGALVGGAVGQIVGHLHRRLDRRRGS